VHMLRACSARFPAKRALSATTAAFPYLLHRRTFGLTLNAIALRSFSISSEPDTTHFGYQNVPTSEKTRLVANVFDSVSSNYDKMNDFMSLGVHRLWKEYFVNSLQPLPGTRLLDVAGGTGDIAFRFLQAVRSVSPPTAFSYPKTKQSAVVVCDINPNMLAVGKQRARDLGYLSDQPNPANLFSIDFVEGDAEKLPFPNDSFDAYTIAFGLRNVTHMDRAVAEAHRVLRPGGRFMCLEFSHVTAPGLRQLYDAYSFSVIPWLGQMVAQDRPAYQYLVESIRRMPTQEALADLIRQCGFRAVSFENLTFGIVAIHSGFKL